MSDLMDYRRDFPQLDATVREHPLVYLDNAATTLKPKVVIDTVADHYRHEVSNIHRGVHFFSEQATLKAEQARQSVAGFINAPDTNGLVFTSGATAAFNQIAYSLGLKFKGCGGDILISEMEHHSNLVPWQIVSNIFGLTIKKIPLLPNGDLDQNAYEDLLSSKTRAVAFTHVSNVLGTINPVCEMVSKAREVGAVTVVDAAQSIAHLNIDVQELGADFVVFSAHKIFGPTGIGAFYASPNTLMELPRVFGGGGMIERVDFSSDTTFAPAPAGFEAGTPHIAGMIGFGEVCSYLSGIGMDRIRDWEEELTTFARQSLREVKGLEFIGAPERHTAVISFKLGSIHPHDVGTLVDKKGVAIRVGHHCCQPLMRYYGVPATSRMSLAFYNTREDIETLVEALEYTKEVFG